MKREWTDLEFADRTLLPSEAALLANKTGPTRLGFAISLKFFQYAAHFPLSMQEVPATAAAQEKAVTHVLGSRDLVTAITGRAGIRGSSRRLEELLSAATEGGETAEPEHKFRERSKHVLLMKPGGKAFPQTHRWNGS
jgi:hypothetical protein